MLKENQDMPRIRSIVITVEWNDAETGSETVKVRDLIFTRETKKWTASDGEGFISSELTFLHEIDEVRRRNALNTVHK